MRDVETLVIKSARTQYQRPRNWKTHLNEFWAFLFPKWKLLGLHNFPLPWCIRIWHFVAQETTHDRIGNEKDAEEQQPRPHMSCYFCKVCSFVSLHSAVCFYPCDVFVSCFAATNALRPPIPRAPPSISVGPPKWLESCTVRQERSNERKFDCKLFERRRLHADRGASQRSRQFPPRMSFRNQSLATLAASSYTQNAGD